MHIVVLKVSISSVQLSNLFVLHTTRKFWYSTIFMYVCMQACSVSSWFCLCMGLLGDFAGNISDILCLKMTDFNRIFSQNLQQYLWHFVVLFC